MNLFRRPKADAFHLVVGIEEEIYCPVSYVRVINHLQNAPAGWVSSVYVLPREVGLASEALPKASGLLLARASSPEAAALAAQARESGLPVIYDIDDYLWRLPEYLAARDLANGVDRVLAQATLLTTPSAALGEFVRQKFPKLEVRIVPNSGDIFTGAPRLREVRAVLANSDFFRLPAMKREFFEAVRDGAREAGAKVSLYYLSNDAPEHCTDDPNLRVIWCGIRSYSSYRTLLESVSPEIAFVPLADDHFSRYKSVVKFAEFGFHGIAGIYSRVEPYRSFVADGQDGWLTANSPRAWRETARHVLSLPETERKRIRDRASDRCRREFSGDAVRADFFDALRHAGVRTVAAVTPSQPPPAQEEFVFRESYDYMVGRCAALAWDVERLRKVEANAEKK